MAQLYMSEKKMKWLVCKTPKLQWIHATSDVRIRESPAQKAFILFKKSLDTEYIIVCWYTQSDMKTAKNIY